MSKYDNAGLVMIPSGYKASKVYSVIPNTTDGDFDFSRGSTATRVNKDGLIEVVASNVPRLDYPLIDGVVQDCPSLLLEPQRTNSLTYSEAFDNAYWTKNSSSVMSGFNSPNGNLTADLITVNSGVTDGSCVIFNAWNTSLQTFSLFAKKGNYNRILLGQASNSWWAVFDLEDGFVASQNENLTSSEIIDYGNGWYRCVVSHDNPSGTATLGLAVEGENNSVYVWGAQLEEGSYPTSYIPTSGSSVTRVAETCDGAGNADTFNDSEGVLFAEISALSDIGSESAIAIGNGGYDERVIIYTFNNYIYAFVFAGGVNVFSFGTTEYNVKEANKIALKYKSGDYSIYINGIEKHSSTSTSTPSGIDRLNFNDSVSGLKFYGRTKQLMTFNKALTDQELIALTS